MLTMTEVTEIEALLGTAENLIRKSPSSIELMQALEAIMAARAKLPGRVPLNPQAELIILAVERNRPKNLSEVLKEFQYDPANFSPLIPEAHGQTTSHQDAPLPTGGEAGVPRRPESPSQE